MVSLAFHLFVVGTVIFATVFLCQVKSSQELLYSFKGKCATHKATKTVYVKDEHLRSTQQHIVSHTSQYNTKHNHHYSHDTSSSLELSQSMPKLISATGSYWNGRIPVAISNFSGTFIRSFVH